MKKTLLVFAAILLFGLVVSLKMLIIPSSSFGMASAFMADVDALGNETMWGWGIAGQGNINKYFGIVGEWNANHGASTLPAPFTGEGEKRLI